MLQSFAMMTFSLLVLAILGLKESYLVATSAMVLITWLITVGAIMDDPRWDPKPSDKKEKEE